jgi:hypothetical protein
MSDDEVSSDSTPTKPMRIVDGWIAIAVQVAALVILLFGDIGFDHPGRFGLDFDDWMRIASVYVFAVLYGTVRWAFARNVLLCALQLVPPAIYVLWYFVS